MNNLSKIKEEIYNRFPNDYLTLSTLFYIDNDLKIFSSIEPLKSELIRLNLIHYVVGYAFYIAQPFYTGSIHTDTGDFNYSLNIPLLGCDESEVCFYNCKSHPVTTNLSNNPKLSLSKLHSIDCNKIVSINLTSPCIINVKIPHNIINLKKTLRLSFLIRLGNNYILT